MSIAKNPDSPPFRASVIIPACNARRSIAKTLQSLVSDAPLIEEILLVDDSSTDGTASFAKAEGERIGLPVRVLQAAARGAGAARNAGLNEARAPLIYFIDADDAHVEGGLTMLSDLLASNPGSGMALGAYIRNVDGKKQWIKRPAGYSSSRATNARSIVEERSRSIATGSVLIRREAVGNTRFPEGITYDEDTIFFAAILAGAVAVNTNKVVCIYNVDSGRAERRFCLRPRESFLNWRRALKVLLERGIPQKSLKQREGMIALKIARVHYARHEQIIAARFVRLALAAPLRLNHRIRALRYRAKIRRAAADHPSHAASLTERAVVPAIVNSTSGGTVLVTVDPAWPPVSGAELRNWGNAVAAAQLGPTWLISLGALRTGETEVKGIRLHSLSPAHAREIYRRPANGSAIDITIPPEAVPNLRALAWNLKPTNAVVESLLLHPLLWELRRSATKLVLDLHNVESDLLNQLSGGLSALFGRSARKVEQIRGLEKSAASLVDEFWTCSEIDAVRLHAVTRSNTFVRIVPNAIPRFELLPKERRERNHGEGPPRLLFVGHLSYRPNVLAAKFLARSILPRLQFQLPGAQLVLAGRNPKPRVSALAGNGVKVVGNPVDVADLLAAADFAVLPISIGGGTRIKAIEAMAWGIPVVASERAVEGLGLIDRLNVRFAQTPRQFCEAISSLWSDAAAYRGQSDAAREHALAHFGPEAIAKAVHASFLGETASRQESVK